MPNNRPTVTAGLTVHDAAKAIEFYKKAFGAQEIMRMPGPGGKIIHAEVKFGDSVIFVNDEFTDSPACRSPKTLKGATSGIFLSVDDCDAAFNKAVKAGGKPTMQPADMFWGDRFAQIEDPFGHYWSFSTHQEDLSAAEIEKRKNAFFASASRTA